jgi:hypothetical protein
MKKVNLLTITDDMIRALSAEAAEHGDDAQVEICRMAIYGDNLARLACVHAINDARAMADEVAR